MNTKRLLPDAITSCNLLCGCLAVYGATQGNFEWAFLLILFGAFFDFFDGLAARTMGVVNNMGIELDSLADDITFGLAPAMILSCYLKPLLGWWSFIALLMAVFSALRLAKFNLDTRQTSSFIGLATPANAIFWGGLCTMPTAFLAGAWMPWTMLALSLVSCYLLISEIPLFSLKFHDLSWKNNYVKFIFLIGCVILIGFCIFEAVRYEQFCFALFSGTICIVWYLIINGINLLTAKQ